MKISHYTKFSLNEYSGKIASIVFTQGCNFRCPFCQNPELIPNKTPDVNIDEDEILIHLNSQKGKLQAVVITGGEPLIQKGLTDFIKRIKSLGYLIKLNTNGSIPDKMDFLIKEKLVDYIAMDIKAPLSEYREAVNTKINPDEVQKSIDILMASQIEYEFRLTLIKDYSSYKWIDDTIESIKSCKRLVLNRFNNSKTLDPCFMKKESFSYDEMIRIQQNTLPFISETLISF